MSRNKLTNGTAAEKSRRSARLTGLLAVFFAAAMVVSAQAPASKTQKSPNAQSAASQPIATNTGPTVPPATETDDRYRIGPGDVLDIRIFNRANLSRDAVRVEGNGMIRMPLIDGEIQAACKTEGELAREIAGRYTKFYRNPQVDVFIKEYRSKQVSIIGAVNEQSRFELQRRVRLLDLLSYAKGPTAKAGQTINIVHSVQGSLCRPGASDDPAQVLSSYRLSDTLRGDPKSNPYLEAGDTVTLPDADQIYVVGNVYTPLTIPLKEPITLSRAVAMAGGLKQDSKKDKIKIVRQEPGSLVRKELTVDLSAIEKKKADDVALMPNDIIEVQTSSGKALLRSLIGGAGQSISNLPIRVIP